MGKRIRYYESPRPIETAKMAHSLGLMFLSAVLASTWASASGLAIDSTTHRPLSGARVTLHCMGVAGLEGPTEIRRVSRTTDAAGAFSFSSSDLAGCSNTLLGGEMDGYHADLSNNRTHAETNPSATLYFLPNSEWLRQLGPSPLDLKMYGTSNALTIYNLWFSPFSEAKKAASTLGDIAYVRERYCDPLRAAYEKLNDRERSAITRLASQHRDEHGHWIQIKTNTYEQDVVPFCTGP
jgi:hypothetical protein